MKTTWRIEIGKALAKTGDSFEHLDITLSDAELDEEFWLSYASEPRGKPFRAWSDGYVYFPTCYDGYDGVDFVQRDPGVSDDCRHIGGSL